jgi:hypothetical protein
MVPGVSDEAAAVFAHGLLNAVQTAVAVPSILLKTPWDDDAADLCAAMNRQLEFIRGEIDEWAELFPDELRARVDAAHWGAGQACRHSDADELQALAPLLELIDALLIGVVEILQSCVRGLPREVSDALGQMDRRTNRLPR